MGFQASAPTFSTSFGNKHCRHMSTVKRSISLSPGLAKIADDLVARGHYQSFSELVADLLRREARQIGVIDTIEEIPSTAYRMNEKAATVEDLRRALAEMKQRPGSSLTKPGTKVA